MTRSFWLEDVPSTEAIGKHLPSPFNLRAEPVREASSTYMDSYDWRLTTKGGPLRIDRDGTELLAVRETAGGETTAWTPVATMPHWPQDLPEGPLRDEVLKASQIRALLPVAEVTRTIRRLAVLNEDDKTVVKMHLAEADARIPEGTPVPPDKGRRPGAEHGLKPRLTLQAVKGYDREREAVAGALAEMEGVRPTDSSLLEETVTALGRRPGDYSSKIDVGLQPEITAVEAARRIHRHLLDTLEANVEGARADLDSEFLHDLRVATRRTRSALTQIKGVFPPDPLTDFKERFRWLGQITGPTRDLDVFLLGFDDYRARVPATMQGGLEPFRAFLERRQREEQQILAKRLASPHFRKLLKDWRAFLERPLPTHPDTLNARRPAKVVADERIWKMFRRVIKEGRAITEDSPHEEIHELRKSCKKLRYLMEFFQDLYPRGDMQPLIKAIKALLDNLGEFQDLEVHAHKIREDAEAMAAEGSAGADTLMAMGALVDDLLEHQARVRGQFASRFADFDAPANCKAYKALFKPAREEKRA
ncbi:CYTH and CHAD domain-containing protein [Thiohalorhabdus sp.]|uniref:CYTH and CHAD domain-containing protein n=1 Tax=Thiohalorhabdus sp. TaxID=3094134 RepID=UPI002FC2A739